MTTSPVIEGAGGGGGSKKQRTPVESPNTLRSAAKGRILDLIAHGPISGLVDGMKSIYLDDTPLQNSDGTFNFEGVVIHTRNGYPDQDYIEGFPSVENTVEVGSAIKFDDPVVRSITNNEADAALVTIQVQALSRSDKKTGDIKPHSVGFAIDAKSGTGQWSTAVSDTISGKTMSPYQRTYRVNLSGDGPFDLRVRRLGKESETTEVSDALVWTTTTEVIDAKLSYPDSALVGIEVDSALFGAQMPSRSYDVELSIISVPSNYNPRTREYTGLWDGTFKQSWTDNPAWAFYDLATHPTIGADVENVDKWALYQISQYCDELVPDGYGGMEPRFTINTLFGEREEAITVLANLASVFRGMCYWGSDTLMPVADMPADPVKLVTPANVIGGEFEYSGTSLRERHSVAIVMWNDPEDNYKAKPEFVEDAESIDLFGWRETQVTALGSASRGQARRLGKWILYSERKETQTLTYKASVDHADLRPGDHITVSDPDAAGARMGGRVIEADLNRVTLDDVPEQTSTDTWFLSVTMPTGAIARRQVLSFDGNSVNLLTPFSTLPLRGAVWVLSSLSVNLPIYRVVSNDEDPERLEYTITATEHDPTKYDRVELDLLLPETPTSFLPTGPISPPSDLNAVVYKYLAGGTEHQGLTVSWKASPDVRVSQYVLEVRGPNDVAFRTAYSGSATSHDELDVDGGQWMFRLRAVSTMGGASLWVARTINLATLLLPVMPDRVDVSVATFSVSLIPRGAYPGAVYEFWRSEAPLDDVHIEANALLLSVSTDLVDVGLKPDTQYYYYVRGSNVYGVSAWFPVQATTLNNFDDIFTALDEDIRRPGGLFDEMVNSVTPGIEEAKTKADEAVAEAVAARDAVGGMIPRIVLVEDGITDLQYADDLLAIKHSAVQASSELATARVSGEELARVTSDQAISGRIDTIKADYDANKAAITADLVALSSADQALASRLTTIESEVQGETGSVNARITAEETARATADEALASTVTGLEASMNGQFASVSQTYSTQAYADGAVARAVTTATVNGKKAVFGISVDNEVAEIGAIADRFYVYNPVGGTYTLAFAVVNGQTVIRDALIREASITMAKISGALQSDNYVMGQTGWALTKSGQFEMNGSAPGQGRLVQTNTAISVYDANNVLRVQLGKLSAI